MPNSVIAPNISNEINDQLAVGNYRIKIGSIHGSIVNVTTQEDQPAPRSRSTPVLKLPLPFAQLLNRQELIKEAIGSLQSRQSVEFYSQPGCGKTALLRYLVHDYQVLSYFPDGVISLSPAHPYVDDILQSIWEAFYESNILYKPTHQEIRQQIQDKQALIVLDADKLIKYEIEELMNAAKSCTFLIASSISRIHNQGRSILLPGLSESDALTLVERELQRPFTIEELPAAKSLCAVLKGHPMHLKVVVASIVQNKKSLIEAVKEFPIDASGNDLIQQILVSLSQPQKDILTLLAVMDGIELQSEQIIAITGIPNAVKVLEALHKRNLVELDDTRYSVTNTIIEALPSDWKVTAAKMSAISYFIEWTEEHKSQPKTLLLEIDPILQIIDVAVRANSWQDVLRLVKAVEGSLALSKRWSLWEQVLQRGLQASQVEQDPVTQAWALHQLGTCALCLEANSTATSYLTKAIQIRESLGDDLGVSTTRHNLTFLRSHSQSQTKLDRSVDIKSEKHFSKETEPETAEFPVGEHFDPSEYLVTRMNIVMEDTLPLDQSFYRSVFLSPTGIITTGILASGGLLAWLNWYLVPPTTSTPSTSVPPKTVKPSAIAKQKPTVKIMPLPIAEPVRTRNVTLGPVVEPLPKIDPPITPAFKLQTPKYKPSRSDKSESEPKSIPLPTNTPAIAVTPTPELTPTPTFTPTERAAPPAQEFSMENSESSP
ncbi:hypothetical protein G7B40_005570 [Aetokthonos hydrillicola Thurmond2011]|jgi:hypothetical protein|uniref:AAA family ATPase n=1 Tax=Aetokthonos hydrillicola Thurmond2011 TaxID=2712845 RepID=A0AAP5I3D2_9CYAN|nr:hypothetical protein [Aetokthonos hydrillicola]MBO3457287.1 hypothetical protein [Aetokthonos hydrillicola CCALA 1050]MBW4586632.1 hypothetical protein [Aetokthonos hydrillicola CCALA 1050]MDR9894041.1 hypothetical protein [Aetokthonos hydrillicola Thurmond2011]